MYIIQDIVLLLKNINNINNENVSIAVEKYKFGELHKITIFKKKAMKKLSNA